MFHKHTKTSLLVLAAALTLVACDSETSPSEPNNGEGTNNGAQTTGLQVLPSANPRVRFKGGKRWADQLSRGLHVDRRTMCQEFGRYDCANDVHFIALGGVEPYNLGIHEPLPTPPISAPIAVDRIALSACSLRAELDLATPDDAQFFGSLAQESAPTPDELRAMGNKLYQALLSRDAEAAELAEFEGFWAEMENGDNPALEWATYTCFAVATSTEMLYY